MSDLCEAERYAESCPFCKIAAAFPAAAATGAATATTADADADADDDDADAGADADAAIPAHPDAAAVEPKCFLVLSAPEVLAFLDILPMTTGHLLVTTRTHREKLADVAPDEGQAIGFWLPLVAKAVAIVTGVSDYNIVQNNGIRAAQVVPHVHFHIIPRPAELPELQNKSWTMFGRGQRGDLDEDEAEALAGEIRDELSRLVEKMHNEHKARL